MRSWCVLCSAFHNYRFPSTLVGETLVTHSSRMAWSSAAAAAKMPVLVLSAAAAAILLFSLLLSVSSPSSPICSCPGPTVSAAAGERISATAEDVRWVRDQIEANGLHMQDNVLRKGINPRTRAQQLQDLVQSVTPLSLPLYLIVFIGIQIVPFGGCFRNLFCEQFWKLVFWKFWEMAHLFRKYQRYVLKLSKSMYVTK